MQGHDVKTVVEPTAMMLGRDVPFLIRLAQETGLQIVPCTGIYTYDHLPINLQSRDADFIADLFVHDIDQGIQGRGARAFIKVAADEPGVNDNIEKLHRAAARACLWTGAPIMAHSRPASDGPQGRDLARRGRRPGEDPDRPLRRHRRLDYLQQMLDLGVWLGMDRYGIEMYLPRTSATRPCWRCSRRATLTACSCPRTTSSRSTSSPRSRWSS